jgi:hypothetical protein
VLQYSNKQGFSKNPVSKNWLAVLKEGSSTIIILVDLRIIPSGIDFSSKHVETVFWGTDWDTNMEAAFSEGCVSNSGRSAMRCQWSLLIQENRMKNLAEYEHGLRQQIRWLYQGILYLEVYPGSVYSPFACSTSVFLSFYTCMPEYTNWWLNSRCYIFKEIRYKTFIFFANYYVNNNNFIST